MLSRHKGLLAAALFAGTMLGSGTLRAQALPNGQMAVVLGTFAAIEGQPFYTLSPQDARQQFSTQDAAKIVVRVSGAAKKPRPVGAIVDQLAIPGPGGGLPVRIYRPTGVGPFPVVVYFHGGGFVIATIDTYDASARALTDLANVVVVSVEYRKAPEHPFPSALEDALSAYKWAVRNSAFLQGIPGKIAVAGESAGGNLATEVCLNVRDQGFRPLPLFQLLVYPITSSDPNTPSKQIYANALPLNKPALEFFSRYTYQNPADLNNPNAFPLKARLQGLPPATIIAAEIDPLQSEGAQYAAALRAAGVRVNYRFYPGVTHEFFGLGDVVSTAAQAERDAAADLDAALR